MRTLIIVAALGLIGMGAAALSRSDPEAGAAPLSKEALDDDCRDFGYDRYDAGEVVRGLSKSDTIRRCEPDVGAPSRINMVATMYGSCEPTGGDGGCAPPLQVQSWPACERNLDLYESYPAPDGTTADHSRAMIRGVPAAVFDGGRRIEVFTGNATVVIFGASGELARAAVDRLVGRHGGRVVRATERLPAPADGAIEGKLAC